MLFCLIAACFVCIRVLQCKFGFAVRCSGLLLVALGCERLGLLPRQLCSIVMPMLAKPETGHRLIILYAGMYRVWQRLRRPDIKSLHRNLQRPYWGAVAGRSALDLSWAQAARSEAATLDNQISVLLLMDFSKFYEGIPLELLRDRLLACGMPTAIVKLLFNTWQSPRIIRLGLHHSGRPLFALIGLPAGCAYADVAVRAFTITEYDAFLCRNPVVDYMSYIDDTGVHFAGNDREVVAGVIVRRTAQ